MERQLYEQKLNTIRKGAYTKISYQSYPCKLKSQIAYKDRVRKVTHTIGRFGLTYANLESQKRKEVKPLSYGTWTKKNYIIENVKGDLVTYLARVYISKSPKHKTITKWYLDDTEVTKEWLYENGYLNDTQYKSTSTIEDCYVVNIENIISIG